MAKRSSKKSAKARAIKADKRGHGRALRDWAIRGASAGVIAGKRERALWRDQPAHSAIGWARTRYGFSFKPQLRLILECQKREPNLKRVMRALMSGARFEKTAPGASCELCAYMLSAESGGRAKKELWDLALKTGLDPLITSQPEGLGFEFLAASNANYAALRWWREKGFARERVDACGADVWMVCVEWGDHSLKAAMRAWDDAFCWETVAKRVYALPDFKRRRAAAEKDARQRKYVGGALYDSLFRAPAIEAVALMLIEAGVDHLRPSSELSAYMEDVSAEPEPLGKVKKAEKERVARFEREQLDLSVSQGSRAATGGERSRAL